MALNNTGNPVPSDKGLDLQDNAKNLDLALNSSLDTWIDRLGSSRDTVAGRIKKMGFLPPITYVGGILFTVNDNVKTVQEGTIIYGPKPESLPFTTSGIFATDSVNFFVVQGLGIHDDDPNAHNPAFAQHDTSLSSHQDIRDDAESDLTDHNIDPLSHQVLIDDHNADAAAHPALSAFITAEADRAEVAADAATISGEVFPDTTAGLAATSIGDFFTIVSPSAEGYLDLFLHDVGDVAVFQKTYPSDLVVTQLQDTLDAAILDNALVLGTDSDMSGPNNWVDDVGTAGKSIAGGSMDLTFTTGLNESKTINAISLEIGREYLVSVKAKLLSGTASTLQLGEFSTVITDNSAMLMLVDSAVEFEFKSFIVAKTAILALGIVASRNNGCVISISEIKVSEYNTISDDLNDKAKDLHEETQGILTQNTIKMNIPNEWTLGLGALSLDFSTNAGELTISFGAGLNESVDVVDKLIIGESYSVRFDARLVSGTASQLTIGLFASEIDEGSFVATPVTEKTTFTAIIKAESETFSIGIVAAENNGPVIAIDNVVVIPNESNVGNLSSRVNAIESGNVSFFKSGGTEGFLSSISQFDKPLTKIAVAGDSLMANDLGGAIPGGVDEGVGKRPIRLDINNIPRRIYDHLVFNRAEHRRVDDAAWTQSGTWTGTNGGTTWEPAHAGTLYHRSIDPSAFLEITIPDAIENFALIAHKSDGFGVINITLDGGSIAAFGASSIDLDRPTVIAGDIGNPYHTEQYIGLPTGGGSKVIRISKLANADEVRVWGGFYWSGNTLVVHNIAHGGHTLAQLTDQHLQAELVENDFDAVLFQLTTMNDVGDNVPVNQTLADMNFINENIINGKDKMWMTTNPFGDDGLGTNFYPLSLDPSMEETGEACMNKLNGVGIPYVDVFQMFKNKIENRGGTLLGGEGGLFYTTDGQHPTEDGAREWFNLIKPHLSNKPYQD